MVKNVKEVKLSDLIAKADKIKNSKKEIREIYVKSLDGVIKVQKPSRDMCMMAYENEKSEEYLVYECVIEPNLKDKNLHEAYSVVDPIDIVGEIFEAGEISSISMKLLSLAGYDDLSVELVDDIKN